jgi:hypothetical protein
MRTPSPRGLAGAGLGLVLVVVIASAAIRLGAETFPPEVIFVLRSAHRTAASLEALVIVALLWTAWRSRVVLAAAAVTLVLAVVGVLAGRDPPAGAALVNILGGLALAACFSIFLKGKAVQGAEGGWRNSVPTPVYFFPLLALQALLGAVASLVVKDVVSFTVLVHALIGTALTVFIARAALHMDRRLLRFGLLMLALIVPAAGFGAALFGSPWSAALAHAVVVALFVSAASFAFAHAKPA